MNQAEEKKINNYIIPVCFPFFLSLDKSPAFGTDIISISVYSSDICCSCLLLQGELAHLKRLLISDCLHKLLCFIE